MRLLVVTCFLLIFSIYVPVCIGSSRSIRRNEVKNDPQTIQCLRMKQHLFEDIFDAKLLRDEFERYLPVFLKTNFDTSGSRTLSGHEEFNLLGPIGPQCKTPIEHYGEKDEEKKACGLRQLQTIHASQSSSECVIYSFGCNNVWSFEEEIVKKTNCRVETFDCTMSKDAKVPKHLQSRVRLHTVCIGDSSYVNELGQKFLPWSDLHELTGLRDSPAYLKIDIEGYEFPVIQSIIKSGKQLPLQIAMEIHLIRMEKGKYREDYHVPSIELYSFINLLYKYGGYYLIDRRDNFLCPHCSEVLLARLDCFSASPSAMNQEAIKRMMDSTKQNPLFIKAFQHSINSSYYK